jgi:hypothetical protein
MGRSIVYCDKCGQLLKEEDFLHGRAFTADNRNYCAGCRPTGSSTALPQAPRISSSRIPKQPPKETVTTTRLPKQPSQRIPVQAPASAPPAAPAADGAASAKKLYLGVGGGLVVVVVILGVMMSGNKEKKKPTEEPNSGTAVVSVKPAPTENLPPEDRKREEAARAACVKAYEVQTTRPKDLVAQWRAFEAAASASQGTSYSGEADAQIQKLRRKFEEERTGLETPTQAALSKEQFKSALDLWEGELNRYELPEWSRPMNQRIAELKSDFERRLGVMREAAADAKRRGDEAESKRLRARVAGWGLAGYAEQIDQALAAVVPVKPDPPPETGTAKPLEAYRARWKDVVAPAGGRDYAEAVKALEKLAGETKDDAAKKEAAEDLDNLKLAATVIQEAGALLPKLPKGQRIALSYWDAMGSLQRVEDVILKIDAHRMEVKFGEGSIVVPFGEVAAATLADLHKSRGGRGAVAACLLDGDAEGAQRFRGEPFPTINDKYGDAAKAALQRRSADDREKTARRLFTEAERGYFDYGETAEAVAKYKALLAEHGGTEFVRRNKGAISARTESPFKDFYFGHADLNVASFFKLGKYGKIEGAWASQQDIDAAKMKDNFVDFEFAAGTEGEYRPWVHVGGCCQEVLTFYVQGTELVGPTPESPKDKVPLELGGATGMLVKSTYSSMKKLHSQHTGPKNPERFEWIQLGTFKYPTAGAKRIRILSNQKGFAVAGAAVISSRNGPPRESEMKELEKWRAETPGASLKQGGIVTGQILREVWRGIGGGFGEFVNNPAFKEDRPTERNLINQFEGPQDWADEYGTRIRGYVHPPATGDYVFSIATDDGGELWLSTDEDPRNKEKIAFVPDFTSPRDFSKHASQTSKPVPLKAGRRYYVEALQKEGGGGDHVCVKWKLPSGAEELPIPGSRLSPFVPVKK